MITKTVYHIPTAHFFKCKDKRLRLTERMYLTETGKSFALCGVNQAYEDNVAHYAAHLPIEEPDCELCLLIRLAENCDDHTLAD